MGDHYLIKRKESIMLANTITVSVNAVNKILTRVKEDPGKSIYKLKEATGQFVLTIKQTSFKDTARAVTVERHAFDLVHTLLPVAPATHSEIRKSYIVIENDADTVDYVNTRYISKAVSDYTAVAANVDPIIAGEY